MSLLFSGPAAAAYDAGRAPYEPAVLAALDLPAPPSRVLDLAAGTGLLSRALLAAGHEVVAVEPAPEMAAGQPGAAERRTGTAEATGLPDAAVDAVAVGDAWHWFDAAAAAQEVHRVLRPRGRLALVWRSSIEEERPAALAAYHALLWSALSDDHPGFRAERGREALTGHPGFAPLLHRTVRFVHRTDREGLLAEAASASFVNALEDREAFMAALAETVVGIGPIEVAYLADVWLTTRRR